MKKIAIIILLIIIAGIIGFMRLKLDSTPEPAIIFLSGVGFVVFSGLWKRDKRKELN